MRNDLFNKKEEILEHIAKNGCKSELYRRFKCKPETLNSYLDKMGISYKGNSSRKGIKNGEGYKSAAEYLGTGKFITSHKLKEKLIKDGLKEHRCERCGRTEWQGNKIPLELHHKDGDHWNNDLDNLEILCPNCHALEPNNSGAANIGG